MYLRNFIEITLIKNAKKNIIYRLHFATCHKSRTNVVVIDIIVHIIYDPWHKILHIEYNKISVIILKKYVVKKPISFGPPAD